MLVCALEAGLSPSDARSMSYTGLAWVLLVRGELYARGDGDGGKQETRVGTSADMMKIIGG